MSLKKLTSISFNPNLHKDKYALVSLVHDSIRAAIIVGAAKIDTLLEELIKRNLESCLVKR